MYQLPFVFRSLFHIDLLAFLGLAQKCEEITLAPYAEISLVFF
jgi:hypothetical protein